MSKVTKVTADSQFQEVLKKAKLYSIAFFWAEWHPPCKQMAEILKELSSDHPTLSFYSINVEAVSPVAEAHHIKSVPTFLVLKAGQEVERVEASSAPKLVALAAKYAPMSGDVVTAAAPKEEMEERLKKLVRAAPVMMFIKGTPEDPKCGYTRQIVELFRELKIKFGYFDINTDDPLADALSEMFRWPTFPQVYINGELIGGLDVCRELHQAGELQGMLPAGVVEEDLNTRLKALVNQHHVMAFIKGSPSEPKCGFTRQLVELFAGLGVDYGHFDILLDQAVREGLKKYSDWPTFPQVYVDGKLVGGLDVINELKDSGELMSTLKGNQQ